MNCDHEGLAKAGCGEGSDRLGGGDGRVRLGGGIEDGEMGRWATGRGRWRGGNGNGKMAKGVKGRGRKRGKRRVDFRDGYDEMPGCNEVTVFSDFVYPCNAGYPS